ncbi:hypothetical protein [Streptomyces sp. NPDC005181]|uniref:hypothetical protein n=1 Tax=Streptomyces sp. NPDC005181 TaxID=3156869 RepID=UPI0033ABB58D
MYAPGHPPTPTPMPPRRMPSRAWIVSMRVLFVVLAVGSIGLLLWTPLLRLAIVRRKTSDWWLTGAGFVLICVLLPIIGREGSDDPSGVDNVLIPLLLLAMVAAPAYYLVGDIRHYEQLRKEQFGARGYLPPGYGYTTMPVRQPLPAQPPQYPQHQPPQYQPQPQPQPQPQRQPYSQPSQPQQQPPQPPPVPHASGPTPPHRIDQVRAELDELSDYLRKEEDR